MVFIDTFTTVSEPFVQPHSRLGEGPLYDHRNGVFSIVDIIGKNVHWYDYNAKNVEDSHKWVTLDHYPGVLGLTSTPMKYVAAVTFGFAVVDLTKAVGKGELVTVQFTHKTHDEDVRLRFNDGVVDPRGRFFAGTMSAWPIDPSRKGALYRQDLDGSVRKVIGDVGVPNGQAFSPDEKTFYFTDSDKGTVFKYDYDAETGEISNRTPLICLHAEGKPRVDPDGMAISEDGHLWIAVWGLSRVQRYTPEGQLVGEIAFPAQRISCPAFAGKNLDELVVTAASLHLQDANFDYTQEKDLGGEVFRAKVNVRGLPKNIVPIS